LGFSGSGSQKDPYIIENLEINALNNTGIFISFTTKYFLIRNCKIDYGNQGIRIASVESSTARIENNKINNCTYGIHIFQSNETIVESNLIDKSWTGIWTYQSGLTEIKSNTISSSRIGLQITNEYEVKVINNTCDFSAGNGNYGVMLDYARRVEISYNTFKDTISEGVWLKSETKENVVHHNNFLRLQSSSSQGMDDGQYNKWYDTSTNEGNHWSEYTGHGEYEISGAAGATDPYPLQNRITFSEKANYGWMMFFTISVISIIYILLRKRNQIK
jgi:parallel beta-helix repeat protein